MARMGNAVMREGRDEEASRIPEAIRRLHVDPALLDLAHPLHLQTGRLMTRPFSHLAWVDVRSAAGIRRLIVKSPRLPLVPSPEAEAKACAQFLRQVEVSRLLAERFAFIPRVGVPRVVAYLPEVPALVMEHVDAVSVHDLVTERGRWTPAAASLAQLEAGCFDAGVALRRMQEVTTDSTTRYACADAITYVEPRLARLQRYGEIGADYRAHVLGFLYSLQRRVDPDALVRSGVHGDYCPSNVLVRPDGAMPLDFSMFHTGSAYFDASRFIHQLDLFLIKPWYRERTIGVLRRRFLAGFAGTRHLSVPLLEMFTVAHVLNQWLGSLKGGTSASRLYNAWVSRQQQVWLTRRLTRNEKAA